MSGENFQMMDPPRSRGRGTAWANRSLAAATLGLACFGALATFPIAAQDPTPTPIPQAAVPQSRTPTAPPPNPPAVVLPDSARRFEPAHTAQSEEASPSLEVQSEPDGSYVTFAELLRVIRDVDPEAQARWDGLLGVFRIDALGRNLQALSNQPVLVIDGKTISVEKPIRVKSGIALVPVESVNEIFRALEFEFALPEDPRAAPSIGAPSSERPAEDASAAAGTGPTGDDPLSRRRPRPSMLSAEESLLPDVGKTAMAQLDIPQVGTSVAGLTWDELTDYAHPRPPRRMTIVYDPGFESLARLFGALAQRVGEMEISLVGVQGRRDDRRLLSQVAQSRPEVLIDLISSPPAGGEGSGRDFEVWTVHEALWISPGKPSSESQARPMQDLYAAHQFHNLALGSVLRTELARGFPDGTVRHELAPCYLLRRIDAPSAAVVVPEEFSRAGEQATERIARALAGGFAGYYMGVKSGARM